MNSDIYSVLALFARYGFALLMLVVVFRAFAMTNKDARRAKNLRNTAQPIGELIEKDADGEIYALPESGCIGTGRGMDVRVSGKGIRRKHAFFEQREHGILVTSVGTAPIYVGRDKHQDSCVIVRNRDMLTLGKTTFTLILYSTDTPRASTDDFFSEGT